MFTKQTFRFTIFKVVVVILTLGIGSAMAEKSSIPIATGEKDLTLRHEVNRAFQNGFEYLKKTQNADGSWSNPDFPALTGLVLTAFLNSSNFKNLAEKPEFVTKGLDFILANVKESGAIYKEIMPNYNTSICIMALLAANDPKYHPVILKARRYLISLQDDKGKKGVADELYDGGVGYGSKEPHSDLSNTYMALEAIKMAEFLESDKHAQAFNELKALKQSDLNWEAALKFIQRCQNLPGSNDQTWASGDEKNKGGFIYFPGESKAGKEEVEKEKNALRSYGSMTYAGLLSFIYADLKKDDPRVVAAYDWIKRNYTLDENPGMGMEGLYYYYHTLAKALTVMGDETLDTPDGKKHDWRKELSGKLVEKQKSDGSWVNDSGRWWENDPILVTAYSLIALNMASSFY